ncbi:MAG: S41 family peptidase [Verrucomicrobiota bacterium]
MAFRAFLHYAAQVRVLLMILWLLPTAAPGEPAPIDQLTQADLQRAFGLLKNHYHQSEALTPLEMNRAALKGLLSAQASGIKLRPREPNPVSKRPQALFGEMAEALFLRPAQFSSEELEAIDEVLSAAPDKPLILDLRCPSDPTGGFDAIISLLDRLTDKGRVLFTTDPSIKDGKTLTTKLDPVWRGNLMILLISEDTPPLSELVGAVLQSLQHPVLIGCPSPGRILRFEDRPLTNDLILRMAVGSFFLEDGTSLQSHHLQPEIEVIEPPEKKWFFRSDLTIESLSESLNEEQRPKQNEASLVAATLPDLEYELEKSAGRTTRFDRPPGPDPCLRSAIDYIRTSRFFRDQDKPSR